MTEPLPSFETVSAALAEAGAGRNAAEAHGLLCGLACLLGDAACAAWKAGLVTDRDGADDALAVLERVAAGTCRRLDDADMSFSPLLPDDDDPLDLRARSLARWCRAFGQGFALAEGTRQEGDAPRSGVAGEILEDFEDFARMGVGDEEEGEDGEAAYAELVEYVRVSVQLLFEEYASVRARPAPGLH